MGHNTSHLELKFISLYSCSERRDCRDNVQKRYLIHISGYNLGLIMRLLTGSGTPRRWAEAKIGLIWFIAPVDDADNTLIGFLVITQGQDQNVIIGFSATTLNS